jgi:hypothetical protein
MLVHDKAVKKKDLSLVCSGLWLRLYKHQVYSPSLSISVASRNQSLSCGGKDLFDPRQQPSSPVTSHYCTQNSQLATEDAAAAIASVLDVSWDLPQTKHSLHLKRRWILKMMSHVCSSGSFTSQTTHRFNYIWYTLVKTSSRLPHHHRTVTQIVIMFIRDLVDSIRSFIRRPQIINHGII